MFMSAVQRIDQFLHGMTRAEKALVLQRVVQDLGDAYPGIESLAGVSGGEPCVVRTRIPVWVLYRMREQAVSEADILRAFPTLRAEDLANAWHYASAHQSELAEQAHSNENA